MFMFVQKYYPKNFALFILRMIELFTRKVCEMFVYKHTETIEYVKKIETLPVNNSKNFKIKNEKFSRCYFNINVNM